MPRTHPQPDLAGRLLAFLVFAVGVGMLMFVFAAAYRLFYAPVPGLGLPLAPHAAPPPAAGIGLALTALVRQLLLLFVMTVAGSLIAKQGIHLYFGASHWIEPGMPAENPSKNGHAPAARPEAAPKTDTAPKSAKPHE